MLKEEVRILTPTGMLGYGIPKQWFQKGLELNPDVITADAGSTDSGPQKLALGSTTCSEEAYTKEIELLLDACHERKIPVYISSAGGDGSNGHVDLFVDIVKGIATRKGYHFKIAAIYSDIDKDLVKEKIRAGKVSPCGPLKDLTEEEVDAATVIVAQMGAEPFLKAIKEANPDVIIAGRAYDPAPTAAYGILHGFDPALSWHMGKIMECGAKCAEPNGRNIFGVLREDGFVLEPLNPDEKCTIQSVAVHSLYEKSHPYLLPGPGGTLNVKGCRFEQIADRSVRVSQSKWTPTPYTVKLEGAKRVGYRAICVAGVRDPILIAHIDELLATVDRKVREDFGETYPDYRLIPHIYGKNGVMAELEPHPEEVAKELCVILEVAAPTQHIATTICNRARILLLHQPYTDRIATSGNVAFPFTPLEIPLGEVCQFNIYHLMEIDDPCKLFPIRYLEV